MQRGGWRQVVSTALAVILIDQVSKGLAASTGVVQVVNEGVSFGWRPAGGATVLVVLLAGVALLTITVVTQWRRAPLPVGLLAGGALSNLIDRVLTGGVRDWLPVPFLELYNNLADWAIAAAVILLIKQHLRTIATKATPSHEH